MSRVLKKKELKNTRLASTYGGWVYCEGCAQNIGYLCYVTYDFFHLEYDCTCGNHGLVLLTFEEKPGEKSEDKLVLVKNRFCCPEDKAPLFTILEKKLHTYKAEVLCKDCHKIYIQNKESK